MMGYIIYYIVLWNNYDIYIWVNYNDLTVLPKPGIMVSKGNHPHMSLIQVSENI